MKVYLFFLDVSILYWSGKEKRHSTFDRRKSSDTELSHLPSESSKTSGQGTVDGRCSCLRRVRPLWGPSGRKYSGERQRGVSDLSLRSSGEVVLWCNVSVEEPETNRFLFLRLVISPSRVWLRGSRPLLRSGVRLWRLTRYTETKDDVFFPTTIMTEVPKQPS